MERPSKRAFYFSYVLFTLVLIVSSATDEQSKSDGISKPGDNKQLSPGAVAQKETGAERTDTKKENTEKNNTVAKKPAAASETVEKKNCTIGSNESSDTPCDDNRSFVTKFWDKMSQNREMLKRTLYVLLGVTGIVIVYFAVRTVRLRRRRNKSRKYGVIATRGDLEMEPLGQGEDEDEDYTVFEMNGRTK